MRRSSQESRSTDNTGTVVWRTILFFFLYPNPNINLIQNQPKLWFILKYIFLQFFWCLLLFWFSPTRAGPSWSSSRNVRVLSPCPLPVGFFLGLSLALLSASVKRVGVSRMRDFFVCCKSAWGKVFEVLRWLESLKSNWIKQIISLLQFWKQGTLKKLHT